MCCAGVCVGENPLRMRMCLWTFLSSWTFPGSKGSGKNVNSTFLCQISILHYFRLSPKRYFDFLHFIEIPCGRLPPQRGKTKMVEWSFLRVNAQIFLCTVISATSTWYFHVYALRSSPSKAYWIKTQICPKDSPHQKDKMKFFTGRENFSV